MPENAVGAGLALTNGGDEGHDPIDSHTFVESSSRTPVRRTEANSGAVHPILRIVYKDQ